MTRSASILVAAVVALLAAAASASAAPVPLPGVIADDLHPPLEGWTTSGSPRMRGFLTRPKDRMAAMDGDALALGTGGSIRRSLPPRPWSLSLDVRLARGSAVELRLGGAPLRLRRLGAGALRVTSGGQSATLERRAGWGRDGWHHLEVAGFDPAEIHVDGSRVPHGVRPGGALRIRTLSGTAHLTGLVATPRDDPRALLLHRLAEIHVRTAPRRYPFGTGADDGVLRFQNGWAAGLWAGSLWGALDLAGGDLFRKWGLRATSEHLNSERKRTYEQGLRLLSSSAASYERTCSSTRHRRCAVMVKTTGTAMGDLWQITFGNEPAVITSGWPGTCAACGSDDEVELRLDSLLGLGLFAFEWRREEREGLAHQAHPVTGETGRDLALRHARAVVERLVRPDGSTIQAVRFNRRTGALISNERHLGYSADSTWARGHAAAIHGLARTGAAFDAPDLVQAAERAAGHLARELPASGVPPYDFDAPDPAPDDTAAGALGAAALMHLAAACERMPGTCSEPSARWRELGLTMLNASLARVNPHAPMGVLGDQAYAPGGAATWDDRGEFVFGIHFALEAIALSRR